jgi:hypothetical protein
VQPRRKKAQSLVVVVVVVKKIELVEQGKQEACSEATDVIYPCRWCILLFSSSIIMNERTLAASIVQK